MGLRFRKSYKIAPGIKLNVGKKSIGVSAGNKYGGISASTSGRKSTRTSIPGTGISFVSTGGGGSGDRKSEKSVGEITKNKLLISKICAIIMIVLGIIIVPFCLPASIAIFLFSVPLAITAFKTKL